MVTSVRLSHCRFLKNRPCQQKDIFDKVVTSVWTYEPETSILTYAATVYTKSNKSDFWNKKEHKKQALQRFDTNPIRVRLLCFKSSNGISELTSRAVDWFISTHLVYEYGVFNKTNPDVRRVQHERHIRDDFNQFYDPYYTSQEFTFNSSKKKKRNVCSFPWKFFLTTCLLTSASLYYSYTC